MSSLTRSISKLHKHHALLVEAQGQLNSTVANVNELLGFAANCSDGPLVRAGYMAQAYDELAKVINRAMAVAVIIDELYSK